MGDSSFLNVTLLSAQGLKDVCTFGTMSPYAKAWLDPSMKQRTPVASNAGCTPVWGHRLSLPLPSNALKDMNLKLFIQVMNQGTVTDTIVGSATITLDDLIRTTTPNGIEFMAVQLERPSGRVQGLVNFSVEIADQSVKYHDPPTSSSSKSTGLQNSREKFSGANVRLPDDTMAKKGLSVVGGGRLSSRKEPLAAPDALGSGHSSVLRHESLRSPQQILELSGSRNEQALDPLGPSKRSDSTASSALTPPTAVSKGTAGTVAPDALDRSVRRADPNTVDSSHAQGDRAADDNDNATPSYAHLMFGGVVGALLMGETISNSKASVEHGGSHGHGDPQPGDNPSGLPHA